MKKWSCTVDLDSLLKLLMLCKRFDEISEEGKKLPLEKFVEKILVRKNDNNEFTFQAKGGVLWKFFNITLSGRELEYDLGRNFRQLSTLFSSICGSADDIRRSVQVLSAKEGILLTVDPISSLLRLKNALNAILEYVARKKTTREKDKDKKIAILQALQLMKIEWNPIEKTETQIENSDKKINYSEHIFRTYDDAKLALLQAVKRIKKRIAYVQKRFGETYIQIPEYELLNVELEKVRLFLAQEPFMKPLYVYDQLCKDCVVYYESSMTAYRGFLKGLQKVVRNEQIQKEYTIIEGIQEKLLKGRMIIESENIFLKKYIEGAWHFCFTLSEKITTLRKEPISLQKLKKQRSHFEQLYAIFVLSDEKMMRYAEEAWNILSVVKNEEALHMLRSVKQQESIEEKQKKIECSVDMWQLQALILSFQVCAQGGNRICQHIEKTLDSLKRKGYATIEKKEESCLVAS